MQIDMPHFDGLEPNVAQHVLWDSLETLTPPGEDNAVQQQTRDRAVAALLEKLRPETEIEALFAAQIVALHHGAMGCYRWSMQTEPTTRDASRLRRDGMAMTRTMIVALRELRCLQADRPAAAPQAAPQPMDPPPATAPPAAADAPLLPPTPPQPAPQPEAADAPIDSAAQHAEHPPLDLTKRERGKTDWHSTRAALRVLESRDQRTLTDDELEAVLKARATPEHPYDPSWREIKPLPHHPYWEDLTPEERRARYGWRSEEEIEAAKAAAAAQEADTATDQPPTDPPRPK